MPEIIKTGDIASIAWELSKYQNAPKHRIHLAIELRTLRLEQLTRYTKSLSLADHHECVTLKGEIRALQGLVKL